MEREGSNPSPGTLTSTYRFGPRDVEGAVEPGLANGLLERFVEDRLVPRFETANAT